MRVLLVTIIFCLYSYSSTIKIDKTNSIVQNSKQEIVEVEAKSNINNSEDDEFADDFSSEFDEEFKKEHKNEVFDPLSGYNRIMTSFNDKVYTYILNPVASTYAKVLHEDIRIGISNFLDNLMFPVRFANNLLQFKFMESTEVLGRFVVNSIWGFGGFLDPASEYFNMEAHNEDFGQTLGYWGVGEGFHIVLPFLGPSNLRDTIALIGDYYISPVSSTGYSDIQYKIPRNLLQSAAIKSFTMTNTTSLRLGQYENIKKDALDLYPYLRDIYSQNRKRQIEE